MQPMERPPFQLTLASLLGLVACIALNIWLFQFGPLLGIIGLNVTKHVVIAYVCQVLGVDRRDGSKPSKPAPAPPASLPVPELPSS
jgi:hypothetical protein